MRETETEKRRSPRWMKVLLIGSLAVNLAIAGLVAGAAWRFAGPDGPPRAGLPLGVALYRALPEEDRRALRRDLRTAGAAHRQARRAFYGAVPEALRADPPDFEALDRLLADERRLHGAWQDEANRAWRAHVGAMTREARADYADRVEDVLSQKARKDR